MSELRCLVSSNDRGYRWNTPKLKMIKDKETHTDIFWEDIKNYDKDIQYYFGHFIFIQDANYNFTILDGLQRIITISLFASALFERLKKARTNHYIGNNEKFCFDDLIKIPSKIISIESINTLKVNNYVKELVFEMSDEDQEAKIKSIKRIIKAYEYFLSIIAYKSEEEVLTLLNLISNAHCSTFCLELSNKMSQYQIYQVVNFRGKKISKLLKEEPNMFF